MTGQFVSTWLMFLAFYSQHGCCSSFISSGLKLHFSSWNYFRWLTCFSPFTECLFRHFYLEQKVLCFSAYSINRISIIIYTDFVALIERLISSVSSQKCFSWSYLMVGTSNLFSPLCLWAGWMTLINSP